MNDRTVNKLYEDEKAQVLEDRGRKKLKTYKASSKARKSGKEPALILIDDDDQPAASIHYITCSLCNFIIPAECLINKVCPFCWLQSYYESCLKGRHEKPPIRNLN